MRSKIRFFFYSVIFGINYTTVAHAEKEVHTQGSSTAIIEQKGGGTSTSEVIKTPEGQKIITSDGKNTSVVIQESGATKSKKKPNISWNSTSKKGNKSATAQEFKERIRNRTRALSPRR